MITLTNEEYNAIMEAREELVINEFESDIKAAYAAKRKAEKLSGYHDAKERSYEKNRGNKYEPNKKYYHSTTPGRDARDTAIHQNAGAKVDKGGRTLNLSSSKDNIHPTSKTTTLRDKKIRDKENANFTKSINNDIKRQDRARSINKFSDKIGIKGPRVSSYYNGNISNTNFVKEAVIDWYIENGLDIDDYEMGRIDSFVESYCEEEE